MRTTERGSAAILLLAVTLAGGGRLEAQTPITSVGLGFPPPPIDARAAALGGVGVGLLDGTFSIRNPADLVEFERSGISVSTAPEDVDIVGPGVEVSNERNRFSTIRAIGVIDNWSFGVGFGSVLDRDFSFRFQDTLNASTGRFPFDERRVSDGGMSSIDFSIARALGPLSVGASFQKLNGSLRQELNRRFETNVSDSTLAPPRTVNQGADWSFDSWRVTAGLGVNLGERVRISGSYYFTDDLSAERDTLGIEENFDMPSGFALGASGRVLDNLLVTAGGGFDEWSETDADFEGVPLGFGGNTRAARAEDTLWLGGGVEYDVRLFGVFPLRLRGGGRYTELPFALPQREAPTERAFSFGLGTGVSGGSATIDAALELGERGDFESDGVEEDFQRFTITATIRQ